MEKSTAEHLKRSLASMQFRRKKGDEFRKRGDHSSASGNGRDKNGRDLLLNFLIDRGESRRVVEKKDLREGEGGEKRSLSSKGAHLEDRRGGKKDPTSRFVTRKEGDDKEVGKRKRRKG